MRAKKLTDADVEKLPVPPQGRQVDHWDPNLPSFGVRVSYHGTKSWIIQPRVLIAGKWKPVRITLGRYPGMDIADARAAARRAFQLATEGKDPRHQLKDERAQLEADSLNEFGTIAGRFMTRYVDRKNLGAGTRAAYERALQGADVEDWKSRPVASITRKDVRELLETIADRGAPILANRTLAYLRRFFGWCVEQEIINATPTAGVKPPSGERPRDRALSPDEIGEVWRAIETKGEMFAPVFKLLLLTGQRKNEVGGMRWDELHELDGTAPRWELPGHRSKNRLAHTVPLSPHSPEHRARHVLQGSWQPGAQWRKADSLLLKLLDGCFKDDDEKTEKIGLLSEVCGAAVTGCATRLRQVRAIVLYGKKANNGKSQFLDVLRGLVPPAARAAIPPANFRNPYLENLPGKLLNTSDELSGSKAIGSETFKIIVDGRDTSADRKYRTPIDFRPRALHVFATNTLPRFGDGMDRGVQRRLLVIPFDRVIPENEQIESLGARIAETEPDLILAFAVEGARQLIQRCNFSMPQTSKDALREWLSQSEPVRAWVFECCEIDETAEPIEVGYAYQSFRSWVTAEGFADRDIPDRRHFTQKVKMHDDRIGNKRTSAARYILNLRVIRGPGNGASSAAEAAFTDAEDPFA